MMRLSEAQFEVEKDEGVAVETEFQTLEYLQYMIEVQKDHMKAVWQEAKLRDPLVKSRVRPMNRQARTTAFWASETRSTSRSCRS